jgi:hypothetical protein
MGGFEATLQNNFLFARQPGNPTQRSYEHTTTSLANTHPARRSTHASPPPVPKCGAAVCLDAQMPQILLLALDFRGSYSFSPDWLTRSGIPEIRRS